MFVFLALISALQHPEAAAKPPLHHPQGSEKSSIGSSYQFGTRGRRQYCFFSVVLIFSLRLVFYMADLPQCCSTYAAPQKHVNFEYLMPKQPQDLSKWSQQTQILGTGHLLRPNAVLMNGICEIWICWLA